MIIDDSRKGANIKMRMEYIDAEFIYFIKDVGSTARGTLQQKIIVPIPILIDDSNR